MRLTITYVLTFLAFLAGSVLSSLLPLSDWRRELPDLNAAEQMERTAPPSEFDPPMPTTPTALIQDAPAPAAAPAPAPAASAGATKGPTENPQLKEGDWNQWGGNSLRNNTPLAKGIPTKWKAGGFDRKTGAWLKEKAINVKWVQQLGSQTYGNPVVADGKIFVGTNNGAGFVKRYPNKVDLGCLVALSEKDGSFLWQDSSEKLSTGRVHDWPLMGICCAPLVEGKRLWYVTSRGEIKCLDTEGFRDGKNDGVFKTEANENKEEADVIWMVDMMKELGVSQHNMCSCSITSWGDLIFVCTSNGVDDTHLNVPAPNAPSFLCVDKNTGKIHWTDNSPSINIHHGQWSSPTIGILGGVPQVLFGGGDGWLYSFKADTAKELLWRFDCNPKEAELILGGRGTRNDIVATPVIHSDRVYVATGQDPEHGDGEGILWCIDPTKRGNISPELAVDKGTMKEIPYNRIRAVDPSKGELAVPNPNSAVVWKFTQQDRNNNKKIDYDEQMHRSCGTVAIQDGILYITDFSGVLHCIDEKTGKVLWAHDMLAASWGSPLIVDGHVYVGDEDGDISVFKAGREKLKVGPDINMTSSVFSTPIVANGVLYIANKDHLFAIAPTAAAAPATTPAPKPAPAP